MAAKALPPHFMAHDAPLSGRALLHRPVVVCFAKLCVASRVKYRRNK